MFDFGKYRPEINYICRLSLLLVCMYLGVIVIKRYTKKIKFKKK